MNEVKKPKKSLLYYYGIVILVVLFFNLLLMPKMFEQQIEEVDYGTFMSMTEEQNIGRVQVEDNQILFSDKDGTVIYKTGVMNDPGLIERLKASGAVFSSPIVNEASPMLSFLLTWIMPLVIFIVLGQIISRKMVDKAGGPNSMMFNMGKSNAKIYVKSSDGIKFSDVAGEDEAKENLAEILSGTYNKKRTDEGKTHERRKL